MPGAVRRSTPRAWRRGTAAAGVLLCASAPQPPVRAPTPAAGAEWPVASADNGGSRYSPLTQITAANVGGLRRAWSLDLGSARLPPGTRSQFEATPIKIGDTLYLCTPDQKVYAVDAETGARRWTFDAKVDLLGAPVAACRGLAAFRDAQLPSCPLRLFLGTVDARLIALDARTGRRCADFGRDGEVDLAAAVGPHPRNAYGLTSAPVVSNGRVVVGGRIVDNQSVDTASGVVRAFDARSGALAWTWDADGGKTSARDGRLYAPGTPNAWAPMSADEALKLVYVPTGNASPDYWGGRRSAGSERYASSVVALDVDNGAVRWSFQTTHHDLWDYDVGSQPLLVDLTQGGQRIPALLQPTKRGQIFLLDRRTGAPIGGVVERPVPQGAAAGDRVSPTQPYGLGLPSFEGRPLTEESLWGLTPFDALWCRIRFRQARYNGPFTPPGVRPTLAFPGNAGGFNWAAASFDAARGRLFVHWQRMATYVRLIPRAEADREGLKVWDPAGGQPRHDAPMAGAPFAVDIKPFQSPIGVPCQQPPYGMIAAVDLGSRRVAWSRPLGSARDSGPLELRSGLPAPLGTPLAGGSLAVAGGVVFIGATQERAFRALDAATGRILWSDRLHTTANAGPMTYVGQSGRQYVVVAVGGSSLLRSPLQAKLVAYALPQAGALHAR